MKRRDPFPIRHFFERLRCAFRGHRPAGTSAFIGSNHWSREMWLYAQRCDCGAWIARYE